MKNKFLLLILFVCITANSAYAAPLSLKSSIMKFLFVMGGVLLSSLIIFFGLVIYNKIRESLKTELSPEEEILTTPKSKDDAIRLYIRKNKLR